MFRLKNLGVLMVGEGITRLLSMLAFIHLARALGPAAYGLVETTLAVMMFATLSVDQGFATLGAREVARRPEEAASLASRIVSTQMILAFVAVGALLAAAWTLPRSPDMKFLLGGYSLSLLGYPFLTMWVFQGLERMTWYAIPQVVRQAAFAAVVFLFIRGPLDLRALPLAEIAGVVAAGLVLWIALCRGGRRLVVHPRGWDAALLRENLPIGGSQLLWVARMYLPLLAVGLVHSSASTGRFGAAHRLVMLFQTLLTVYFVNLFPGVSRASAESHTALLAVLRRSIPFVVWPAVLVAAGALVAAPGALELIYGPAYRAAESVAALVVLMWVIPVIAWRRHAFASLVALHHPADDFYCSLLSVVLQLILLPLLLVRLGAVGAAWAMLISETIAAAFAWTLLRRRVPALRSLPVYLGWPAREIA